MRLAVRAAGGSLVLSALLLGASAWSAAGPRPENAESCAALTHAFPATPCSFDFSRFRFHDPVSDAAAAPRKSAGARVYTVHDAREVRALNGRLRPGDEVVFANGEWRDAAVSVRAEGTAELPITFHAETDGKAEFTGTASAAFSGSNLVVRGLAFRRGKVVRNNFVVFRLGAGDARPCNQCSANRIAIEDYNSTASGYDTIKVFYMALQGRNITVANSLLSGKKNYGTMVSADLPAVTEACPQDFASPADCHQRLLFIHNRLSGFSSRQTDRNGNHKLIQLGWSGVSTRSAFSVLSGNTFENATGENETISLKASDVIVRGNIFRANRGTLNLRSANRVLVENNVFDGAGIESMGGVRIEGRGHWIAHNTFRNLFAPMDRYYWPVAIHTASDEELRDNAEDYARVKDVVIAGNRFENDVAPPIAIGIFPDPRRGRTLLPDTVFLIGNSFAGIKGPAVDYIGGKSLYPRVVERDN